MYTLDTNAIIYYLGNEPKAAPLIADLFSQEYPIFISTITEIELFSSTKISPQEFTRIERLLKTISAIPLDSAIARIAASLRRLYNLKLGDSAIAATAIFTNSILVTRNIADFKKITNLKLLKI